MVVHSTVLTGGTKRRTVKKRASRTSVCVCVIVEERAIIKPSIISDLIEFHEFMFDIMQDALCNLRRDTECYYSKDEGVYGVCLKSFQIPKILVS